MIRFTFSLLQNKVFNNFVLNYFLYKLLVFVFCVKYKNTLKTCFNSCRTWALEKSNNKYFQTITLKNCLQLVSKQLGGGNWLKLSCKNAKQHWKIPRQRDRPSSKQFDRQVSLNTKQQKNARTTIKPVNIDRHLSIWW